MDYRVQRTCGDYRACGGSEWVCRDYRVCRVCRAYRVYNIGFVEFVGFGAQGFSRACVGSGCSRVVKASGFYRARLQGCPPSLTPSTGLFRAQGPWSSLRVLGAGKKGLDMPETPDVRTPPTAPEP